LSEIPRKRNEQAAEIRAVVLDYGEVLCHRPTAEKTARMAEALGLDAETFAARYQFDRGPYDRGDLSPAEYWSGLAGGAVPFDDGLLDTLREWDVDLWSHINPDMADWMDRVSAAGYQTALLSNMHVDMAAYARQNFDWLARLDCVVLSCEVRLVKPETAIYRRCLEGLSLQTFEALFIDDREVNVRAARHAGFVSLRFESVEKLREDLADMGFPVLPVVGADRRGVDAG
jgi:putative hydrolase of the HAD superfamily